MKLPEHFINLMYCFGVAQSLPDYAPHLSSFSSTCLLCIYLQLHWKCCFSMAKTPIISCFVFLLCFCFCKYSSLEFVSVLRGTFLLQWKFSPFYDIAPFLYILSTCCWRMEFFHIWMINPPVHSSEIEKLQGGGLELLRALNHGRKVRGSIFVERSCDK